MQFDKHAPSHAAMALSGHMDRADARIALARGLVAEQRARVAARCGAMPGESLARSVGLLQAMEDALEQFDRQRELMRAMARVYEG